MTFFEKKQTIFMFIALAIVTVICFFILFLPSIKNAAYNYNTKQILENSNISFQVPSPDNAQIKNLKREKSISDIFPYYDLFSDIKFSNGATYKNSHIQLVDSHLCDTFPFMQKKLRIQQADIIANETSCFIDYAISKKFKVKIGDTLELKLANKSFIIPIVSIVQNSLDFLNSKKDTVGFIGISLSDKAKSEIEKIITKKLKYSGAYIVSSNHNETKKLLQDYKPLGRLKSKNLFKSNSEYKEYLDFFNSTSYVAEISDFSSIPYKLKSPFRNSFIGVIIMLFSFILITLTILSSGNLRGRLQDSIQNGKSLSSLSFSLKIIPIVVLFITSLFLFLLEIMSIKNSLIFAPMSSYFFIILLTVGVYFVIGIIFINLYGSRILNTIK